MPVKKMTNRFVVGFLISVAACSTRTDSSSSVGSAAVAPANQKDPMLARRWIGQGAAVIDVRTAEEFAEGHVDRAINIPVEDLAARMSDVSKLAGKDQPIVVYCASGHRAGKAQRALTAAGYSKVVNGGGFDDLKSP